MKEIITDRTLEDVILAQRYEKMNWADFTLAEKAEWSMGLKGAFNYKDWNRIIANIIELTDKVKATIAPWKLQGEIYRTENIIEDKVIIENPTMATITIIPFKLEMSSPDTHQIVRTSDTEYVYEKPSGYHHFYVAGKFDTERTKVFIVDKSKSCSFSDTEKSITSIISSADWAELKLNSMLLLANIPRSQSLEEQPTKSDYEAVNTFERRCLETYDFLEADGNYVVPMEWFSGYRIDSEGGMMYTGDDRYVSDYYMYENGTTQIIVPEGTMVKVAKYVITSGHCIYQSTETHLATKDGVTITTQQPYYVRIATYKVKPTLIAQK